MMKDKHLIKGLAKGDNKVFDLLYREYFSMVEYLVTTNSGDTAAANDIFQEVMLVLYEKARDHQLFFKASIKTICYSIARNLWLKELRKKKSTVSLTDYEQFIEFDLNDTEEQADFLNTENISRMQQFLTNMGRPCKPLLIAFYFDKKSLKELMQTFGYKSTNSVKTQKYKCFRRLQSLMHKSLS